MSNPQHFDSEPELIVTEERLVPPTPKPIEPPASPPAVESLSQPETEAVEAPTTMGEELNVPVPKTQPIRINPRPDSLLPPRNDAESGSAELPRLDVNLAAPASEAAPPPAPTLGATPPTRVQLPQVGETLEAFSPEDFFTPGHSPSEVYPGSTPSALDDIPDPHPDALEPIEPVSDDLDDNGSAAEPPLLHPDPAETEQATPDWGDTGETSEVEEWSRQFHPGAESIASHGGQSEELHGVPDDLASLEGVIGKVPIQSEEAPDQFSVEDPGMSSAEPEFPFDDNEPLLPGETVHAPQEDYPGDEYSLHEGSFENLLSQRIDPGDAAPTPDATSRSQVVSPDFPFQPSAQENPPSASMPSAEPEGRSDADVLDEMFGHSPSSRGMKKSTIVMLSIIAAVAIIATISVFLIINALGGVNPYPELAEKTTPPPYTSIEENGTRKDEDRKPVTGDPASYREPDLDDAPAVIDPVARERVEPRHSALPPAETSPDPQEDTTPPPSIGTPPSETESRTNPASLSGTDSAGGNSTSGIPTSIGKEDPALTFDQRLENTMERLNGTGPDSSIGGGTARNLSDTSSGTGPGEAALLGAGAAAVAAATQENGGTASANYNPPASFPAPDGSESSPLGKTHDLLDAFLRAPDWESRIPYIYRGESLRPAIEQYYKKWPFTKFDRFSLQLFQMEQDQEMGGPYWVYLVSTSDEDQGYPVIVRVEEGNLKVDWEIYSEFQDQHFAQFLKGSIASPHTFRLVIERVSDYYGPDRKEFSELGDYLVYQVNPPYGDLGEFSEYAFVKRDTELAKQLDEVVGLTDEPLAVIITLDQKRFSHGVTHEVITDYVTEGWFR